MFKARNLHETFLQSLGAARKSGNSACHKRKTTFLWQRRAQRGSMERRSGTAIAPHRSLGPLIGALGLLTGKSIVYNSLCILLIQES